ncbi:nitrate- and nitrite sensing domain-containing protein [Nocardia sp. CDC153]|uniref:sensor histidine kinase n=1 Tax=Nocardia sp. CDC153 TaxID=3112167 RepID=UPI002DBA726A|nr:nitrate- and nitrite sensing domain-containing protein [Nocardia sp. CDC153]MEC3956458.1 nitrate- and nitrite sensing domain-containing protein [Nocardia sp. CDC153]
MFRARLGVRTRVLAIALVPSLALLAIGVGGAGYLVVEGKHAREWAEALTSAAPTTNELIVAVQQERQLSLAQMGGGDDANPKALAQARSRLDKALQALAAITPTMQKLGPKGIGDNVGGLTTLSGQLASVRTQIDTNAIPVSDAYYFYGKLLEVVWIGTRMVADTAPSSEVALEVSNGLQIAQASEMLSREASVAEVLFGGGSVPPELAIEFSRVAGTYRVNLGVLAGGDGGVGDKDMQALMNDPDWTKIVMMENVLLSRALDPITVPPSKPGAAPQVAPLTFTPQEWRDTVAKLNTQILHLWDTSSRHNEAAAAAVGDRNARNSALAGGGMLAVSALAFLVSLILANRIIRRLKGLRNETLVLADERLPEIMAKLREGKPVDPAAEAAVLDFGFDEIGQVAKAFNHAHAAALAAAVTEARTREGVKAMFLNIAHRSQVIVHRQLEILDAAESKQEDPALLDIYFRLDHLATRERRNAENLIILAGGQPGRQWRNPVQLLEIVRSSVGETLDYTRVKIARLPEVSIAGSAVADLVHLLAELVDNAAAFSPPQSQVEVRGGIVGKGVAIEVIDQGMGMPEAELARVNEILRDAPDFGVSMVPDDFRLGRFVIAQLASRNGISVRLTESDYGGVRAIVLVPNNLTVQPSGRTGEIPAVPRQLDTAEPSAAALAVAALPQLPAAPPSMISNYDLPIVGYEPPAAETPAPYNPPTAPKFEPFGPSTGSFAKQPEPAGPPTNDYAPPLSFGAAAPFDPPTNPRPAPEPQAAPQPPSENGFRAREFGRSHYTGSDVRPALPRRRRQASLAPELAQEQSAPEPATQATRTAEQARDLFSAIENGTRQGRKADPGSFGPESQAISERQEGDGDHLKRW